MTLAGADCCQPILRPFPGGRAWAHSRSCRVYPGQKIDERAPWHDGEPEETPICEEGAVACIRTVRYDKRGNPLGLFHSERCPAHPGERVDVKAYARGRRWTPGWPPRGRLG